MTDTELLTLLDQYRAGLDGEMALLGRLESLSTRQREASRAAEFEELAKVGDERARIMANLVALEHQLKPLRLIFVEAKERLLDASAFQAVVELHRQAAALVTAIVAFDQESLKALKEAELARRLAARMIEKGESTLSAYRKIVAPPLTNATLFNRKG